jgi:hypothetical protein
MMDKHGADGLYSAVKSLMHTIRTKDEEPQQDVAHLMIHIIKPWTIWWWLTSKLAHRKPLM